MLTFNYDRLFEMAFLDRFETSIRGYGLYDVRVLNSGVTLAGVNITFAPEAFSFLKLHGSVCSWTVDVFGTGHPKHQQCYFETPVADQVISVDDNYFFSEGPDGEHPDHLKRPPVLFFPYQRQFIVSNKSGFPFDRYAHAVWDRASELIREATEIHVIGYSFSGIDRGPMLELFEQADNCRRIIVQSRNPDEICNRIKIQRPKLERLIVPFAAPF